MKHFTIDTNRDKLYPDLACYQMDIASMSQKAVDDGADEDLLPSWSKFAAEPLKSQGFFTYMLQAIFEGKHDALELHTNYQIQETPDRRVVMMFLPGSTTNKNMMTISSMTERALPSMSVATLCGASENRVSGQKVSNHNAQKLVKEILETTSNDVIILSAGVAARSFSIPEITELYLAYDGGDNGATIQKMSRTLTPRDLTKIGRVFSLSFDSNRDDKFDSMVMEAAVRVKKDDEDIVSAMGRVLKSIDIFRCTEDGAEIFDEAEFIRASMARNGLSRVMGKIADISNIPTEVAIAMASGNIDYKRMTKVMTAAKGKTREAVEPNPKSKNKRDLTHAKMMARVREMISTIVENMDILIYGTGEENVANALVAVEEQGYESAVADRFGVEYEMIKFVFQTGIIKQDWVDIRMQVS
jgi:hypothetical protein